MGGKAKLLDSVAFEQAYTKATSFKRDSEDLTEYIRYQLNQLTDPAFLDRIKVERGEDCLASIHEGAAALEELLDLVSDTSNLIEKKIAEAVRIEADKPGSKDGHPIHKNINNKLNLKR